MDNPDIDTSRKLFNRLDTELTALARSMSETLGKVLLLKSSLEILRENQELCTTR